jgi:hypothetical protein
MTPKQTPYAPPGSHPPGSPAENHLQPLAAFPDGERCEGHGHPGPRDGSVRRRVVAAPAVAGGQCHPATSGASVEVADVRPPGHGESDAGGDEVHRADRRARLRQRRPVRSAIRRGQHGAGADGPADPAVPASPCRRIAGPARRPRTWQHADHPDLCGLRPAWTRSQVTAVLFTQCEISRAFPRGCGLGVSSLAVLPPGSCLRAW